MRNFSLSFLYIFRVYMGLHLTCKSMKLLFKCQSSSIWTCKTECNGLFRSEKACKHHRTTLRKLVNEKWCFFYFCHIALACINIPFLFVTDNVQKWERGDHSFRESNSLILSVADLLWVKTKNTNTDDDTYTIIPDEKEEFRHLIKCETRKKQLF